MHCSAKGQVTSIAQGPPCSRNVAGCLDFSFHWFLIAPTPRSRHPNSYISRDTIWARFVPLDIDMPPSMAEIPENFKFGISSVNLSTTCLSKKSTNYNVC
jgi:hypothetical protein